MFNLRHIVAPARLLAALRRYPALHGLNAALALAYTFVQTVILARVLATPQFSAAVAVTAVSLYLLPWNQAVARANFVLVRETMQGPAPRDGQPEAATAFQISQAVAVLAGIVGPLAILALQPLATPPVFAAGLVAFGLSNTLGNLWYFEIQSVLLALDRPVAFEAASLVRRAANVAALAWLWVSRDFLTFGLLLLVQAVLTQALLLRRLAADTDLFNWPRAVDRPAAMAHLRRLWTSAQATAAEWLTLNGPYALVVARFGVGPALVSLDIGMKFARASLTATRSLSEIALPRVSRSLAAGRPAPARAAAAIVLALGMGPAMAIAGVLLVWGPSIFHLLLGPNSVVPAPAAWPFALLVVAAVGFQAGVHLLGYLGRARQIAVFTLAAIAIFALEAAWFVYGGTTIMPALWAVSLAFTATAVAALSALAWTLSHAGANR